MWRMSRRLFSGFLYESSLSISSLAEAFSPLLFFFAPQETGFRTFGCHRGPASCFLPLLLVVFWLFSPFYRRETMIPSRASLHKPLRHDFHFSEALFFPLCRSTGVYRSLFGFCIQCSFLVEGPAIFPQGVMSSVRGAIPLFFGGRGFFSLSWFSARPFFLKLRASYFTLV